MQCCARVLAVLALLGLSSPASFSVSSGTNTVFAGETCDTAISYGTIPPNHSEPDIAVSTDSSHPIWRSFVVSSPRKIRLATATSAEFLSVGLKRPCDIPIGGIFRQGQLE